MIFKLLAGIPNFALLVRPMVHKRLKKNRSVSEKIVVLINCVPRIDVPSLF